MCPLEKLNCAFVLLSRFLLPLELEAKGGQTILKLPASTISKIGCCGDARLDGCICARRRVCSARA